MTEPTPADPAGQPTEPAAGDPPPEPPKDPQGERQGDEPLGEAGLKALQAERDARKELEKKLSSLEPLQKLAEALGSNESGKADPVAELEKRLSTHEEQLEQERSARWRAEVAHEKNLTPQQAERLRGSTREELAADADELLSVFPAPEPPKKFQGSGDGGARPGGSEPSQITREELKSMTPTQIVKAKSEGRLNDLLGHK